MTVAQCSNCKKIKPASEMLFLGEWFCNDRCRIQSLSKTVFKLLVKQGKFVPFDYEHERNQYDE